MRKELESYEPWPEPQPQEKDKEEHWACELESQG
jgi:hypothetical protein